MRTWLFITPLATLNYLFFPWEFEITRFNCNNCFIHQCQSMRLVVDTTKNQGTISLHIWHLEIYWSPENVLENCVVFWEVTRNVFCCLGCVRCMAEIGLPLGRWWAEVTILYSASIHSYHLKVSEMNYDPTSSVGPPRYSKWRWEKTLTFDWIF